ncbi:MAG: hypothetical protein P4L59_11745 [Desulfosporosinus sp.]|nr:hypothetical protein [Desulfosporosinus sp.]
MSKKFLILSASPRNRWISLLAPTKLREDCSVADLKMFDYVIEPEEFD